MKIVKIFLAIALSLFIVVSFASCEDLLTGALEDAAADAGEECTGDDCDDECAILPESDTEIVWYDNISSAVCAAKSQEKLVLLIYGRPTCGNCNYTKGTVCESVNIKSELLKNYNLVFIDCDSDANATAYPYIYGSVTKEGNTLPFIALIDPDADATYNNEASSGIPDETEFLTRLKTASADLL